MRRPERRWQPDVTPAAGTEAPPTDPGAARGRRRRPSPEAPAETAASSPSSIDADDEAVSGAFENTSAAQPPRRRGVCAAVRPGGLPLGELPVGRGACEASVAASIGTAPKGGAPAWRRTRDP